MLTVDAVAEWSSPDVLTAVKRLAADSRELTADLVALLAAVDERRLYEADGCNSVFEFCVRQLRLSEAQAYHRIQAARAARRFPVVLAWLREGRVTLTSVALLRPVLTPENHERVLAEAAGRSKREVEQGDGPPPAQNAETKLNSSETGFSAFDETPSQRRDTEAQRLTVKLFRTEPSASPRLGV